MNTCIHCGLEFKPNPRVKKQEYCSRKECQRSRRARWQRQKMATDPAYKDNQKQCQKQWQAEHPDYYKKYRAQHPGYVKRNRILQIIRNARNCKKGSKIIAKMDSLGSGYFSRKGEVFRLIPQDERLIAKMDSLIVKLVPVRGLESHKSVYG